ncbi:uncharacterized protein [Rutidosis leptorrhynchoides]|uniref:uncharacterized protein n=1 Tax=Rutidosis leptorrhynchoides TaxID=125765 RepID=UPI003A98E490
MDLTRRLKRIVPGLIGEEQSAFMEGRYILDGVLIALETVEFVKGKKSKSFILKVDFEKAFDCIDWNYLSNIMELMGFQPKWIKWINSCLTSTSISVLVNASKENLFKGVSVGNNNIKVSHLQYADDTIIFGEWDQVSAKNSLKILKCFEDLSGLRINLSKSSVYGIDTSKVELETLSSWLGCQQGTLPFPYLWLPIGANLKKPKTWLPVIEKFDKRLSNWHARTISYGGRSTLIKSGRDTSFWLDRWLGTEALKDKYQRLYRLEVDKDVRPRGRNAADLIKLCNEISHFVITGKEDDEWQWSLDKNVLDSIIYTKYPYTIEQIDPLENWIFIWRAKLNKIPVRIELDKRGIDLHSVRCPVCDVDLESVHHILINCNYAKEVWKLVYKWWNINLHINPSVADVFDINQSALSSKYGKQIWQAVSWITDYMIWKNRNDRVFGNNALSPARLVDEIQIKGFEWISNRWRKGHVSWHTWLANPKSFDCSVNSKIGIG